MDLVVGVGDLEKEIGTEVQAVLSTDTSDNDFLLRGSASDGDRGKEIFRGKHCKVASLFLIFNID